MAVDTVSDDPTAGDLIVGSGGCRKVRIAGRGNWRFSIVGAAKGRSANLTSAQVNTLAKVVKALA